MRTSFESESLGAISPRLIPGSAMPPCRKLQIGHERGEERDTEGGYWRICMRVSSKIDPSLYWRRIVKYGDYI